MASFAERSVEVGAPDAWMSGCCESLSARLAAGSMVAIGRVKTQSPGVTVRAAGESRSSTGARAVRERLVELREDARARYQDVKRCHSVCPEGELWLVLAYLIERILASGLC